MPKKGIMFSLLIESIFWCAFLWAFLLYDKVAIEITESQNESDFDILKEIFQTDTDRGFIWIFDKRADGSVIADTQGW